MGMTTLSKRGAKTIIKIGLAHSRNIPQDIDQVFSNALSWKKDDGYLGNSACSAIALGLHPLSVFAIVGGIASHSFSLIEEKLDETGNNSLAADFKDARLITDSIVASNGMNRNAMKSARVFISTSTDIYNSVENVDSCIRMLISIFLGQFISSYEQLTSSLICMDCGDNFSSCECESDNAGISFSKRIEIAVGMHVIGSSLDSIVSWGIQLLNGDSSANDIDWVKKILKDEDGMRRDRKRIKGCMLNRELIDNYLDISSISFCLLGQGIEYGIC